MTELPADWTPPTAYIERSFVIAPGNPMLRYTSRTRRPGWYVAQQRACLVSFEWPYSLG
jgi:hypothetical protein